MWQRFTEDARRVILFGQQESGQMQSGYVGTEHLLLGLLRINDDEDDATQILRNVGISPAAVRGEIDKEYASGVREANMGDGEPKLTSKAKRVLELAADEARRLRHDHIGTEHLLMALTREMGGLAASILARLGLDLNRARAQVLNSLDSDSKAVEDTSSKAQASPAADSPEAQIERNLRRFVDNLNHGVAIHNQTLIFGARLGWFGAHEWADNWNRKLRERQIELQVVSVDWAQSDQDEDAQVTARYRLKSPHPQPEKMPAEVRAWQERMWMETLLFKAGLDPNGRWNWQIVPAAQFPRSDGETTLGFLGQAAFVLSQKKYEATLKFPATRAINHLGHLSLALLMINVDFGSLAFAPQYVRQALTPYLIQLEDQKEVFVPPEKVFTVPSDTFVDGEAQFSFNFHLCERNLDELPQPEQTVAFYDGAVEQLVFRYDGQAAVAFADGHCDLISPDEAKRLIWFA